MKNPRGGPPPRVHCYASTHRDDQSTPAPTLRPQSHPSLLRLRHVLVHHRRPLRPRRASQQLRPRHDPALSPADSLPDRKSTRLNSSHLGISYAVFCLQKKKTSMCTELSRLAI